MLIVNNKFKKQLTLQERGYTKNTFKVIEILYYIIKRTERYYKINKAGLIICYIAIYTKGLANILKVSERTIYNIFNLLYRDGIARKQSVTKTKEYRGLKNKFSVISFVETSVEKIRNSGVLDTIGKSLLASDIPFEPSEMIKNVFIYDNHLIKIIKNIDKIGTGINLQDMEIGKMATENGNSISEIPLENSAPINLYHEPNFFTQKFNLLEKKFNSISDNIVELKENFKEDVYDIKDFIRAELEIQNKNLLYKISQLENLILKLQNQNQILIENYAGYNYTINNNSIKIRKQNWSIFNFCKRLRKSFLEFSQKAAEIPIIKPLWALWVKVIICKPSCRTRDRHSNKTNLLNKFKRLDNILSRIYTNGLKARVCDLRVVSKIKIFEFNTSQLFNKFTSLLPKRKKPTKKKNIDCVIGAVSYGIKDITVEYPNKKNIKKINYFDYLFNDLLLYFSFVKTNNFSALLKIKSFRNTLQKNIIYFKSYLFISYIYVGHKVFTIENENVCLTSDKQVSINFSKSDIDIVLIRKNRVETKKRKPYITISKDTKKTYSFIKKKLRAYYLKNCGNGATEFTNTYLYLLQNWTNQFILDFSITDMDFINKNILEKSSKDKLWLFTFYFLFNYPELFARIPNLPIAEKNRIIYRHADIKAEKINYQELYITLCNQIDTEKIKELFNNEIYKENKKIYTPKILLREVIFRLCYLSMKVSQRYIYGNLRLSENSFWENKQTGYRLMNSDSKFILEELNKNDYIKQLLIDFAEWKGINNTNFYTELKYIINVDTYDFTYLIPDTESHSVYKEIKVKRKIKGTELIRRIYDSMRIARFTSHLKIKEWGMGKGQKIELGKDIKLDESLFYSMIGLTKVNTLNKKDFHFIIDKGAKRLFNNKLEFYLISYTLTKIYRNDMEYILEPKFYELDKLTLEEKYIFNLWKQFIDNYTRVSINTDSINSFQNIYIKRLSLIFKKINIYNISRLSEAEAKELFVEWYDIFNKYFINNNELRIINETGK